MTQEELTYIELYGSRPNCPVCGEPVNLGKRGYWKYCSISCGTKAQRANKELEQKYKETCMNKYGVDNPAKAKENIEKAKQTCIEKYGYVSAACAEEVKNKKRKTCELKYGIDFPTRLDIIKEVSNIHRNETKKKNGTFNTSKPETDSYKLLTKSFKNVEPQYRSELYPFNCDFYIPELDLYIECNYHWTHGGHSYNKLKDAKILLEWEKKSQTSNFYKNAIETWTIRDVKKLETAKKNKLNYKIFYKINDLKKWLSKQNGIQMS